MQINQLLYQNMVGAKNGGNKFLNYLMGKELKSEGIWMGPSPNSPKLESVPIEKVDLPYEGYKTIEDVLNWGD